MEQNIFKNPEFLRDFVVTLENPSFCFYLICGCLLVLKMMVVTLYTIYYRFKTNAFISEEDAEWRQGEVKLDSTVERIRRVYMNDLENIPLFFLTAFAYLWTRPYDGIAITLFILFTVIRFLHSIVYITVILRQPTRAILWAIGFIIVGYMAIHSALHAFITLVS